MRPMSRWARSLPVAHTIGDQLAVDESAHAITVLDTKQIDKRLVDDAWQELPANTRRGHEARTPDRFV